MDNEFLQITGSARHLHVQVAREIALKILSSELINEQVIPNEKLLCDQFAVSRTVLKEAIKLLTSKGLLESKPKVGTWVTARNNWNFLDPQLLDWMTDLGDNEIFYKEFLLLRMAIEPAAAALAAKNATAEQRILLTKTFQEMNSLDKNADMCKWLELNAQFHCLVFIATCNSFYLPFAKILMTMFELFTSHATDKGDMCIKEHYEIYIAIMSGDSDKARQANVDLLINN